MGFAVGDYVCYKSVFRKAIGIVKESKEYKTKVMWVKTGESTEPYTEELRPAYKGEIDDVILDMSKKMVELEELIQSAYRAQNHAVEAK